MFTGGSVIAIANGAENVIKDETVKNLDDPAPVLETCTSPECVIAGESSDSFFNFQCLIRKNKKIDESGEKNLIISASEIIQGMDLSIDPCEDFYLYACQVILFLGV